MHWKTPLGRIAALASLLGSVFAAPTPAADPNAPPPQLDVRLSPDQRWLAVTVLQPSSAGARAWIVPTSSGEPRDLAELVSAGLTPNGASTLAWDEHGHLRVQVTAREHGVPEMRWLDLDSGLTAHSTRDREVMRTELRGRASTWATVEEKRSDSRRKTSTVAWRDADRKVDIETASDSTLVVSEVPGIVFYSTSAAGTTSIVRCDMATGLRREVARSDALRLTWSVSSDAAKLLLGESSFDDRARVVDAVHGTLLHGPWPADSVSWVSGVAGRYVAAEVGGRHVVIDVLRDRTLETGLEARPWMVALPDGGFVRELDGEVQRLDERLQVERVLFSAPRELEVAHR